MHLTSRNVLVITEFTSINAMIVQYTSLSKFSSSCLLKLLPLLTLPGQLVPLLLLVALHHHHYHRLDLHPPSPPPPPLPPSAPRQRHLPQQAPPAGCDLASVGDEVGGEDSTFRPHLTTCRRHLRPWGVQKTWDDAIPSAPPLAQSGRFPFPIPKQKHARILLSGQRCGGSCTSTPCGPSQNPTLRTAC